MIKLAYIWVAGSICIVFFHPIFGILLDIGMFVYETGILQYPQSIIVPMTFLYSTVYPVIPTLAFGGLLVFSIAYGLFKRYT